MEEENNMLRKWIEGAPSAKSGPGMTVEEARRDGEHCAAAETLRIAIEVFNLGDRRVVGIARELEHSIAGFIESARQIYCCIDAAFVNVERLEGKP